MAKKKDEGTEKDATTLALEKLTQMFTASQEETKKQFEALEKKINASSNGQSETNPSSKDKEEEGDKDEKETGGNNDVYTSEELNTLSLADCLADMPKVERSLAAEYKAQQKGAA